MQVRKPQTQLRVCKDCVVRRGRNISRGVGGFRLVLYYNIIIVLVLIIVIKTRHGITNRISRQITLFETVEKNKGILFKTKTRQFLLGLNIVQEIQILKIFLNIIPQKYKNTRNNYSDFFIVRGALKSLLCFPLDMDVNDILNCRTNYLLHKCCKKAIVIKQDCANTLLLI